MLDNLLFLRNYAFSTARKISCLLANRDATGNAPNMTLETTVVGSYPQPNWLIHRSRLGSKVPRVRAPEIWKVEAQHLEEAQDDATLIAIRDMERAGIDIITDGEMRRESYSNRFATALEGVDIVNPGTTVNRSGGQSVVPRIVAPIRRTRPIEIGDVRFLRRNTAKKIKITLPGPFTMTQQAQDDYYRDEEALAMAYAAAVNEEVRELKAAGADVVQLDEPFLQAYPHKARAFGVTAINRAIEGVKGTTAVHLCFGYGSMVKSKPSGYSFLPELEATRVDQVSVETAQSKLDCSMLAQLAEKSIVLGVLDLDDKTVETPAVVAERIRRALPFVAPQRLIVAPDCGLKYLPRDVAFAKMKAMVGGAAIVRREVGDRGGVHRLSS